MLLEAGGSGGEPARLRPSLEDSRGPLYQEPHWSFVAARQGRDTASFKLRPKGSYGRHHRKLDPGNVSIEKYVGSRVCGRR